MSEDHIEGSDQGPIPKAIAKKYEILGELGRPFAYKEHVYYTDLEDGRKIYRLSLADLTTEKITDEVSTTYASIVVHADRIYFSNYYGAFIYSMDLDGQNIKQINKVNSWGLSLDYPYLNYLATDDEIFTQIDLRELE